MKIGEKIRTFDIIQPGAPIPTSLCQAEAGQKFISKIKIYADEEGNVKVKYDALPLVSVRPFKFVREIYPAGTEITQTDILRLVKATLDEEESKRPHFLRLRIQSEYGSRQLKQQDLDLNSIWQKLPTKYKALIANPNNFILYRKKTPTQRYVNDQLVVDEEEEEDDQAEQLGCDIKSMIKTGTEKDEEDESLSKNIDDLMESIANKLLGEEVSKMFPSCINSMDFLDSLERAEGIGATDFNRTMTKHLDDLVAESVKNYTKSLKGKDGEEMSTDSFFVGQLEETSWEEMDLDDLTRQMEKGISQGFSSQTRKNQVEFRRNLVRRYHGRLEDEVDDPELTRKMENISMDKTIEKTPEKNRQGSDEEIIESSQAGVNSSTISLNPVTSSTQKRQKDSPPSDTFKKPRPKRMRTDPVVIDSDSDEFQLIENSPDKETSKKPTKKQSESTEKENLEPNNLSSKKTSSQTTQRRIFLDDSEDFDFG